MSDTVKNQGQGQQKDEARKLSQMLDYQTSGQAEQQLDNLEEQEQSQEETNPAKLSRRKFLNRMSLAVGGVCGLAVVLPMAGFLVLPFFENPDQPWRDVGAVTDFQAGETKEVQFLDASTRPWAGVASQTAAWLRKEQDGSFKAFSIDCTHLGCPVTWLPKASLFMCPCHGGVFYKDGTVAAGPPPEPLHTYSVKYPREVNWLTGVSLLLFTLIMGFTGQLLRWDQNAIWSVVVGAEQAGRVPLIGTGLAHFILGGNTLGAGTLSRFFSFHVFMIPGLMFIFIGFHLYLVLRNGISTPPKKGEVVDPKTYDKWYQDLLKNKGIPFWPDAAWRDTIFAGVVIATIIALALIVGPPQLDKPPDPTIIQAHPKPDWYFLWYFSILAIIPASSETYVILLFPIVLGVLFFILPLIGNRGERHPFRRPWAMGVVLLAGIVIVPLWIAGEQEPWVPRLETKPLSEQIVAANSSPQVHQGVQLFHDKLYYLPVLQSVRGCRYIRESSFFMTRAASIVTRLRARVEYAGQI